MNNGIYFVPAKSSEFKKADINALNPRNLLHLHMNLKGCQVKNPVSSIEFAVGKGKVIIFVKDKALGFYFERAVYDHAKRNFVKFYPLFNYPCAGGLTFYEEQQCVTMDRVDGICYRDREHDKITVSDLLKFSASANVQSTPDGFMYFLQHGDAQRDNVIWSGDKYTFIDLDIIGFYPPLFDVFHYLCNAGYTLTEIVSMLENDADSLKTVCERANIDTKNPMDDLFYGYAYRYRKTNCNFEDLKFLICDEIKNFPKTAELLKIMGVL